MKFSQKFKSVINFTAIALFGLIQLSVHSPFGQLGLRKVVIDAGHGGKDPGAIGVNGLLEKNVALHVTKKLGEQIQSAYPDVEVIYTRSTDVFIELFERARIANKHNADLFISIHANSSPSSEAYGTETFTLGLHKSEANLEVAKKENSVILMEDNYQIQYEGFDPNSDESYIALTLRQSAYMEQSLTVASHTQQEFVALGRRDRGVKQAGFLVLYKTTMPSVLVELGFVSNPNEAKYLSNNANLDKLANGIFNAFSQYKQSIDGTKPKPVSPPKIGTSSTESPSEDKKQDETPPAEASQPIANNTPETELTPSLYFAVQLASSPQPIPKFESKFKLDAAVRELSIENVYKYVAGQESELSKAVELQNKIRAQGYSDAFVIAIENGKRISISQALKQKNKP